MLKPDRDVPLASNDVIAVRSRIDGTVEMEHLSISGRNDRTSRPIDAAMPLIWRFVSEKFGLQSVD